MKHSIFLIFSFLLTSTLCALVSLEKIDSGYKLTTLYGSTSITEPVLIDLIESPAFQRLKQIKQYGMMCCARSEPEYTRYQHSLGVFLLTKQFGASLEEQIAALLHDVSHTAFSHATDRLFDCDRYKAIGNPAYQDTIHEWYLEQSGLSTILEHYDFSTACCIDAKIKQRCYKQRLPDLCTDRIEYNLTGGFIDGLLSKEEITEILNSLHFENEQWYFDTIDCAKKFALVSLQLCENRWGGAWVCFIDHCSSLALKRAVTLELITYDDIHFSVDEVVWNKLLASTDPEITLNIKRIQNYRNSFCTCASEKNNLYFRGHFSGTNPWVKVDNTLYRLSELDEQFSKEFERVKSVETEGYYIKIVQ